MLHCFLVAKLCPTLLQPHRLSLPDSSVHGSLQARISEWAAISFYAGSSGPRDQSHISCIAGGYLTAEPPGKILNIIEKKLNRAQIL